MKRKQLIIPIIFICIATFISFSGISATASENPVTALDGIMDLSGWDWEEQPVIKIDGEWEFYWNQLLTPDDFRGINTTTKKKLINLPRAWNNYELDGQTLSGFGFATFRLCIKNPGDNVLAIKIPRIFTSFTMWENGNLLAQAGKVSDDSKQMVPQYLPQVHYIQTNTDTIELIIQVANARHRSGGILESIQLGTASAIMDIRVRNVSMDLFLFGSLFIIGFYHIALFLFRTKDRSTLYLGFYSIMISLRTLLVGEIFFIHIFPNFSWELAHKIQTLAYYYGVPLVFMFLRSVFPKDVSKKINGVIQAVGTAFSVLVLLTPARIFTLFNPIYQVFSILAFLYALWIVIITCIKKRDGAYLIGIGLTIMVLTAFNDVFFLSVVFADNHNHFFRSFLTRGDLTSIGLLILTVCQSLLLAKKFSGSFHQVESLTEKLRKTNISLEEKVKERTNALEHSKEELRTAYQAVSRSEKSLQNLMQNVSHDLRTPISTIKGYVSAILDGIIQEPAKQEKYLVRVHEKVNQLNTMVQELFDLSQLESRQLQLQLVQTPVVDFIRGVSEKCSMDMSQANVSLCIFYPDKWEEPNSDISELFMEVDIQRIDRVFTNLLSNAIKFTPEDGQIYLSFDLINENKMLQIVISDTGIGMSDEDQAHIFERFYVVSKARKTGTSSSGLGLAIVKEIVEYHNGQIFVKSKLGEGSRFTITLPVCENMS